MILFIARNFAIKDPKARDILCGKLAVSITARINAYWSTDSVDQ